MNRSFEEALSAVQRGIADNSNPSPNSDQSLMTCTPADTLPQGRPPRGGALPEFSYQSTFTPKLPLTPLSVHASPLRPHSLPSSPYRAHALVELPGCIGLQLAGADIDQPP